MCGPGSNPSDDTIICGLSLFLVIFLATRDFSPGTPFLSSNKQTLLNTNSTWNAQSRTWRRNLRSYVCKQKPCREWFSRRRKLYDIVWTQPQQIIVKVQLRGEVVTSCCHGSKILGWQQIKTSLKKWIRTVSNFIDLIQFHLICEMLAKFSGFNPKGPYLSLQKEEENFSDVFTYSLKRASEISKFHVAVVQQRLRNVQKSVMHVQSSSFANLRTYCFLAVAKISCCCDLEILLP